MERNGDLKPCIINENYRVNNRFCDIYIGEPAFIRKKHAFIRIRRQQGSNIVLVGKDTQSSISIVGLTNFFMAKQSSPESQFHIVDCFNIDNEYAGKLEILHEYCPNIFVSYAKSIADTIGNIHSELEKRILAEGQGVQDESRICLSIVYLQNCRVLKKEGFNISSVTKQLIRIIKEGPEYGIHTILHSFTHQGLMEVIDNSVLNEFEYRIALDSSKAMNIISEPTASRIQELGTVLLQGPDEFTTYNPDLVRVYSVFKHHGITVNDSIRLIDQLIK